MPNPTAPRKLHESALETIEVRLGVGIERVVKYSCSTSYVFVSGVDCERWPQDYAEDEQPEWKDGGVPPTDYGPDGEQPDQWSEVDPALHTIEFSEHLLRVCVCHLLDIATLDSLQRINYLALYLWVHSWVSAE